MKSYWDTSAVINAVISPQVMDRLNRGEYVTRLHTLSEFFATMTGRSVKFRDKGTGEEVFLYMSQNECASWLRQFAGRIQFEDISRDELLAGLDKAQTLNIQGARVYDYWHALASGMAKADELLTRNTGHFKDIAPNVQWP